MIIKSMEIIIFCDLLMIMSSFKKAAPGESAETPGKYCQQKGLKWEPKKVGTLFFLPPDSFYIHLTTIPSTTTINQTIFQRHQ